MFEFNLFSGNSYNTTETTKIRDDGVVFIKQGNNWIGDNGQIIREDEDGFCNLNTGTSSSFGDPFGEDDDEL